MLVHSIGQQWGFASPLDTEQRMREGSITSMPEYLRRRVGG
ncbi:hypothetical protein CCUG63695_01592 [Mycobacteroides franklinii]|uniref:Uncharacterized protein n=1 Tax=Mycobacteroides franklinii TaxID=948102 RepID=A0A4R8QSS9_9MYCO|nr:hypothetical protein CCUG64054_01666 [Mycobacteroides franklinii]TDZ47061.1 hypothetical protein CCUG63697_04837 [Mycobacteroides franklinii]TDZ55190.1 hypothetical protein CCUG63696_01668 [Mycobacteroides franklinii]TDZ62131.1 hypothetical protein CCUG63695_01592 [Mycobacteroides franklinii]TDZ68529.1 hypothetical protein CCUG64056_01666 [Mycobacteroides franklinii]